MAKRVIEILEDDLGDGDAAGTLRFGLDGTWYEIDLSEKNTKRFNDAMKEFVENARRTGGKAGGATKSGSSVKKSTAAPAKKAAATPSGTGANQSGYSNREIRDWARTQGIEVGSQGRLPADIIDQFVAMKERAKADPVAV